MAVYPALSLDNTTRNTRIVIAVLMFGFGVLPVILLCSAMFSPAPVRAVPTALASAPTPAIATTDVPSSSKLGCNNWYKLYYYNGTVAIHVVYLVYTSLHARSVQ